MISRSSVISRKCFDLGSCLLFFILAILFNFSKILSFLKFIFLGHLRWKRNWQIEYGVRTEFKQWLFFFNIFSSTLVFQKLLFQMWSRTLIRKQMINKITTLSQSKFYLISNQLSDFNLDVSDSSCSAFSCILICRRRRSAALIDWLYSYLISNMSSRFLNI